MRLPGKERTWPLFHHVLHIAYATVLFGCSPANLDHWMWMPTRTETAERTVRGLVAAAAPGTRVGSIASISAATGLSRGAATDVMKRFITQGLIVSTRGPRGGYWRTEIPLPEPQHELRDEVRGIARDLAQLTDRLIAVANKLAAP